ncbi:MAG: Glu/Leu/Phe/Val dehydrogenase dimerization domain-containing protein [Ktedonobacteraceae bacterium]
MDNFIFDLMETYDYENIFFCQEKTLGLKAIIVIHDTTLGPAAGGIRMMRYETEADAIKDAARLARSMTYKCAAAGLPYGGGKCVVIGDPKRDKNEALLRALARFIHRLNGLYLVGPDVGTTLEDMEIMRTESPYIVTLPESWGGPGDSAPATAFGVFRAIQACLKEVFGSGSPEGRTVALQGIGSVGHLVLKYLTETGAKVTIADVDEERVHALAAQYAEYDVHIASPEDIHRLEVDVYCPCALGGILNDSTIPELQCKIVCGSANNQFASVYNSEQITQRGILYAPDYIVSAGGVITGLDSLNPGGFNRQRAMEKVSRIYSAVENIFAIAREQHIPTYLAADVMAEDRIASIRQVKTI